MNWTFWIVVGTLWLLIGVTLLLRRRAGGSTGPSRRERLVMATLLDDDNAPASFAVIRRRVGGSRTNVRQLIRSLEERGLLTSSRFVVDVDGATTQLRYRLTDRGVVEVRYPANSQRGRHRL